MFMGLIASIFNYKKQELPDNFPFRNLWNANETSSAVVIVFAATFMLLACIKIVRGLRICCNTSGYLVGISPEDVSFLLNWCDKNNVGNIKKIDVKSDHEANLASNFDISLSENSENLLRENENGKEEDKIRQQHRLAL